MTFVLQNKKKEKKKKKKEKGKKNKEKIKKEKSLKKQEQIESTQYGRKRVYMCNNLSMRESVTCTQINNHCTCAFEI